MCFLSILYLQDLSGVFYDGFFFHCRSVIEVRDGLTFLDLIVIQIEVHASHFKVISERSYSINSCNLCCAVPEQQIWMQCSTCPDELIQYP